MAYAADIIVELGGRVIAGVDELHRFFTDADADGARRSCRARRIFREHGQIAPFEEALVSRGP